MLANLDEEGTAMLEPVIVWTSILLFSALAISIPQSGASHPGTHRGRARPGRSKAIAGNRARRREVRAHRDHREALMFGRIMLQARFMAVVILGLSVLTPAATKAQGTPAQQGVAFSSGDL